MSPMSVTARFDSDSDNSDTPPMGVSLVAVVVSTPFVFIHHTTLATTITAQIVAATPELSAKRIHVLTTVKHGVFRTPKHFGSATPRFYGSPDVQGTTRPR
jgi:hypothetical protein